MALQDGGHDGAEDERAPQVPLSQQRLLLLGPEDGQELGGHSGQVPPDGLTDGLVQRVELSAP